MIPSKLMQYIPARGTRVALWLACAFTIALSVPSAALASTLQGGPVQEHPRIYIVFWGPGWSNDPLREHAYLTNFVSSINGSGWLKTFSQYHVDWHDTRYKGFWNDPDPSHRPGSNPSHAATRAEATRAAHHFGIGANPNITIIVAQPAGGTCSAYHEWDGDVGVAFVNYPYNSDPGCAGGAKTISHELAEAMTDPHPNYPFFGWTDPEVADPCDRTAGPVVMPNGKSFYVQGIWSNAANRCVLES